MPAHRLPIRRAVCLLAFASILWSLQSVPTAMAVDPLTFDPEVPIPGLFDEPVTVSPTFMGTYIRAIFIYFIWVVGILAGVMIIWGGIKWVGAAGNPSRIEDARETINSAIIGIIIALTSVVMLNIINPNLTRIGLPDIGTVEGDAFGVVVPDPCPIADDIICGQLQQVGTALVNPQTLIQVPPGTAGAISKPKFCMGTRCTKDEVCVSREDQTTKYLVGGNCSGSVLISNPQGEFAPYTSMPVNQNSVLGPECGTIQRNPIDLTGNPYSVGGRCGNFETKNYCNMRGPAALIKDTALVDKVTNMACP